MNATTGEKRVDDKRMICKKCGGERDLTLGNRMCRPCYNAYVADLRAETFTRADYAQAGGDWESRLKVFKAVFERHGLEAGRVWPQVKGVRA